MNAMAETEDREAQRRAFERRRRQRNVAVMIALVAFVILIYVVTLVKLDSTPGVG
ncbi:MAG: hypothetical protein ACFCVH_13275 [Alphaproteobacteria bacterium]